MDITAMILSGAANPFFVFAAALALGALHGLEPGHSKTMIAAYIIAVKGSVFQAVLLGVSAAISHSLVVWALAAVALMYGDELIGERLEPWFMLLSGALVVCMALWMARRALPRRRKHRHHHAHDEGAHARAHAAGIERVLASGARGGRQTILFGLTGGLLPCPAAITVFILCMHLGEVFLGVLLVAAFSLGLALTLIAAGAVTALGVNVVSRAGVFSRAAAAAPYLSLLLIGGVGALIMWNGYSHL